MMIIIIIIAVFDEILGLLSLMINYFIIVSQFSPSSKWLEPSTHLFWQILFLFDVWLLFVSGHTHEHLSSYSTHSKLVLGWIG